MPGSRKPRSSGAPTVPFAGASCQAAAAGSISAPARAAMALRKRLFIRLGIFECSQTIIRPPESGCPPSRKLRFIAGES